MIILIAVLSGCIAGILAAMIISAIARLQIERRVKSNVSAVFSVYDKGLTGNLLFLAEKIGGYTRTIRYPRFSAMVAQIRTQLLIMGMPYSRLEAYTFVGIQVLAGFAAMVVSVIVFDLYSPLGWIVFFAAGFFIPYALLGIKVKERHLAVFRQIPDVLDLLVLMMDAGLDFPRAFERVLTVEKGPLTDELKIARQEIAVGKSREEALRGVSERLQYPPVTVVINAFTVSLKTGGSMAGNLRDSAQQFRLERFQMAEKLAGEAPLKLMMPLILLIFPTIFIILFGPIALSFIGGGLF
jgi:tight adherence protein C